MSPTELQARREQIAADYRAAVTSKRDKLAALIARAESSINWGVEWEGDTRVRTFAAAQAEIEYMERRLAEAEARVKHSA